MNKLWAIPPKYLSKAHLFDELLTCATLISLAEKGLRATDLDTLPSRYGEYTGYAYIRQFIIVDELEKRGFFTGVQNTRIPCGKFETPFSVEDTERDVAVYQSLIEEMRATDEFDRIFQLNLYSPEDISSENEFITNVYTNQLLGDHNDTNP